LSGFILTFSLKRIKKVLENNFGKEAMEILDVIERKIEIGVRCMRPMAPDLFP